MSTRSSEMASNIYSITGDRQKGSFSDSDTLVGVIAPLPLKKEEADLAIYNDVRPVSPGESATASEQEDTPSLTLDGGLRSWLQVLGSFLIFFNITGYMLVFGSFENFYKTVYLPTTSASAISWIGSTQTFLLMFASVFVGPLFDLGYFKITLGVGAVLTTLGAFTLGSCREYWQLFLAQGICVGIGGGILYAAVTTLVARSFIKQRSLALGITLCGSPPGAIIYCFMFEKLLPKYGFGWTARAMSFFMIIIFIISIPLLLWKATNIGSLRTGKSRKLFDRTALTDLTFWTYVIMYVVFSFAYWTPFIYMSTYAQTRLGTSQSYATVVLIIANATSVVGRVAAGLTANYIGAILALIICQLISSVICFSWIAATSVPTFVGICALYGCFASALIPLTTALLPTVCPDRDVMGTRLGFAVSAAGFANLIGPPVSGNLLTTKHSKGQDWLNLQLWCGVLFFFSAILTSMLWVQLVKVKKTKVFV